MERRRLGGAGFEVPTVIFGAWAIGGWYWGGSDDKLAADAIRRAVDVGMNAIDTAPIYGCGRSEEVVGEALRGRRERALILTKCGMRWDRTDGPLSFRSEVPDLGKIAVHMVLKAEAIVQEVERSLKRLRTDYIDLYQCHWPDPTTPPEETMKALVRLKEAGKIRAIGLCNSTPALLAEFGKHGPVASEQPRYSPLDRKIERDLLPYCRDHDIATIVYSPIEQGVLTGKVTLDRKYAEDDERPARPWFQPRNLTRVLAALEEAKPIARDLGATLAKLCIAWVNAQPGVTASIVGARTPAQVDENAGAGALRLSPEVVARLTKIYESIGAPERALVRSRVFK